MKQKKVVEIKLFVEKVNSLTPYFFYQKPPIVGGFKY
ncbi:MAG: hypothetical protein ACI87J_002282 [Colwellia sp.]|jgi:hypothetical protein